MQALRWTLMVILILVAGGFIALAVIGDGFRRSFGASDTNPLLVMLPVTGMALLLAGLLFPTFKVALHLGAISAALFAVLCGWLIVREAATSLLLALGYLAAWLVFYWHAAWQTRA